METRIINSLTEINISGGGNFITENYPTYFPTFATRRILRPIETIDNYREITASEKSQLEALAASYERPPQVFIDQWNDCCSLGLDPLGRSLGDCGRFNETTGYFELNGFTDIEYDEAREIVRLYNGIAKRYCNMGRGVRRSVRTLFPIQINNSNGGPNSSMTDFSNVYIPGLRKILFVRLASWQWGGFVVSPLNNSLTNLDLEEVATEYSPLDFSQLSSWNGFYDATNLREVRIINCRINPNLRKSAKISLESLAYLVDNAKDGASFNITVHPDVYAKLTDETNAPWYQLLISAAEKNINFATP